MGKLSIEELNEIGKKIGYPFVCFNDGRVLKVDDDYQLEDDAVVLVLAPIPDNKSKLNKEDQKLKLTIENDKTNLIETYEGSLK